MSICDKYMNLIYTFYDENKNLIAVIKNNTPKEYMKNILINEKDIYSVITQSEDIKNN